MPKPRCEVCDILLANYNARRCRSHWMTPEVRKNISAGKRGSSYRGELHKGWKGDLAKPESIKVRGRKIARKLYPLPKNCERCGTELQIGIQGKTARHHIDGDTNNNDRSNIELLCQSCHLIVDNPKHKDKVRTISKVRYDVSKASAGGDWEHVQPGLYIWEIKEMNAKRSKRKPDGSGDNPMLEVVLKPVAEPDGTKLEGEFNQVWYYVLVDGSQDGRLRALTDALGLKPKGTIDTEAVVGERILAQAKSDKDQDGEYRPRIAKVMAVPDDSAVDEEEEEDEDEDEEDEGIDLADLDRAALRKLIKDQSLGIKVLKTKSDDKLREEIAAALGPEEEEEDEEDEDEDEGEGVDLSALDRAALKKLVKDNELEVRITKTMTDDDVRAAIAKAIGDDEEEEETDEADEEEEEGESNGYDSMSIQDLKNALKERGLSATGKKTALVGRLTEDDQKGGDPF